MQDLSRIWVTSGEEMHFFGGARRVCPGMGSVSGRKCISSVGLGGFVPDLGDFWGGNAFLRGVCPGMGPVSGRKCISSGDLSRIGVGFGEEMHFLEGSCSGSGHRAAGAAFRLSCGGCSERLAGAFASRVALQHFFQINITT